MFTYASVPAPRKVFESEAWRRSPIDINLREMQHLNTRYVYPCPQAPPSFSMLHAKKKKQKTGISACNIEKLGGVWGREYAVFTYTAVPAPRKDAN